MHEKYYLTEIFPAYIRYFVLRKYENIVVKWVSEDYLAWKSNKNLFVFSLCDGVSKSFLGNVASEFLGSRFLTWLWDLTSINNFDNLHGEIYTLLDKWRNEGNKLVSDYHLPTNISIAAQNGLQYRKERIGSETVFLCGRIEKLNETKWQGLFIRMGNVQLQLYDSHGKKLQKFSDDNDKNRWSTKSGMIGNLEILMTPTHMDFKQILLFSDGLKHYSDKFNGIKDKQLYKYIGKELSSKENDDITYLEIVLKTNPAISRTLLPPEILSIVQISKRRYIIKWVLIPGARYEIQITLNFGFVRAKTRVVNANEILHQFHRAGIYYVRVRAIIDNNITQWSRQQVINISVAHDVPKLYYPAIEFTGSSKNIVEWNSMDGFIDKLC